MVTHCIYAVHFSIWIAFKDFAHGLGNQPSHRIWEESGIYINCLYVYLQNLQNDNVLNAKQANCNWIIDVFELHSSTRFDSRKRWQEKKTNNNTNGDTLWTLNRKKEEEKNGNDDRDVTLKRFTRNVCSIFSCWRQIPITHILLGNARLYICWARLFSDISRIYILIWDVCCLWMVEFTRFIAAHSWVFFSCFFFVATLLAYMYI